MQGLCVRVCACMRVCIRRSPLMDVSLCHYATLIFLKKSLPAVFDTTRAACSHEIQMESAAPFIPPSPCAARDPHTGAHLTW